MTIQDTTRLKSLQTRKKALDAELKQIADDVALRLKQQATLIKQVTQIDQDIKKILSPAKITVTEHAMLRYIQHVHHLDLSAIEAEIANMVPAQVVTLGAGAYPAINSAVKLQLRIKDNAVITVIPVD